LNKDPTTDLDSGNYVKKDGKTSKCQKKHCLKRADAKSFKGYTPPSTKPHGGFENPSTQQPLEKDRFKGSSIIGLIGGFAVFGLGYLLTVIYIFVDINKRGKMYDDMIAEDIAKLQMGL